MPENVGDAPRKGCESYGKSIRRAAIEGEFEALLHELRPAPELFSAARAMFEDLWNHRLASAESRRTSLKADLAKVERDIERFLDRIAQAERPSVITAYENRIRKLEERKIEISEKVTNCNFARLPRKPLQSLGVGSPGAQESSTETRVRRPADLRPKQGA
jgi:chromosome segregation ATPase